MTEQRLHELTPEGIDASKNWLAMLRGGMPLPFPDSILTTPPYAQPVEPEIYVGKRSFANRREAGVYFNRQLAPLGNARVVDNPYLWSWLGMFYFDDVVRKDASGNPRLGRDPDIAYVINPSPDSRATRAGARRHAHRLMLAYDIYRQHEEDAWYMLDESLNRLSRFTERLCSAPELFRSMGIVHLAHILYGDMETRKLKEGSYAHDRATAPPGSLSRLIDVIGQLYMTYDVYGMTAEQLLPLLPQEFDRFKYD